MNWLRFSLWAISLAGAQMFIAPTLALPRASGNYLFLLAFHCAQRCGGLGSIIAFFCCGLLWDFTGGGQLGPGAGLFTFCGVILSNCRQYFHPEHFFSRLFFLLGCLLLVETSAQALSAHKLAGAQFYVAAGNSLYTVLISEFFAGILRATWFCPWRRQSAAALAWR